MNIEQIRELEKDNYDKVYIYARENYWYAYDKSAYHLVRITRTPMSYSRQNKDVSTVFVAFGFDVSILNTMRQALELVSETSDMIVLKAPSAFSPVDYQEWKADIACMCGRSKEIP